MKKKIKPQVKFFKNQFFFHKDKRRTISGLAGNLKFNQNFKQMKIIKVTNKSIKKTVIGNHRHKYNSNQWEFIYVLHESSSKPIFEFRYKNYENSVKKKNLFSGDCVIVPPGCALGLLPLVTGGIIIEMSNKIYHNNYEKIELFENLK